MASKTEICNIALAHLGVGTEIGNLDSETSSEAASCRRYYEIAKDTTLRDFPWRFSSKDRSLSLIAENPNDQWGYSYRYPSDCIKMRKIYSGLRTDTNDTRVPYEITRDDAGLVIYTDMREACLHYTFKNDDPDQYPPDFTMALSWRLAMYIAPRVTNGDPFKLRDQALQMYEFELSRAEASDVNEQQPETERLSELERSRS